MLRTCIRSAALAAALGLAGCETISTAPKGAPRVEVEVVYEVGSEFAVPLAAPDREALRGILRDAVRPISDVGLRFYPVPSENYQDGQRRPAYVLTVIAKSLEVDRRLATERVEAPADEEGEHETEGEHGEEEPEHETEGEHGEEEPEHEEEEVAPEAITTATVRSVRCAVEVRFERRRADAPSLIVGEATGSGSASPRSNDPSRAWILVEAGDESNETSITSGMIQRAVGDAATRGLGALQRPIDREFEVREPIEK